MTAIPRPYTGGGYGDVYKWSKKDGSIVSIKCLRIYENSESTPKSTKRISRELYHLFRASHPNVLELTGVALFNGQIAIVSPWMKNGNLRKYIRSQPEVDRWSLCIQIAEGLAHIHSIKMVHGDLKAENILVSDQGVVKISDFGNSILEECSLRYTATSRVGGGTSRWMAWELFSDPPADISATTDVHSLGMANSPGKYEVMTGEYPYAEYKGNISVLGPLSEKRLPKRPEAFASHRRWGDERWALLLDCWNVDPNLRPDSLKVLNRAFDTAQYYDFPRYDVNIGQRRSPYSLTWPQYQLMTTLHKHIVSSSSSLVTDALVGVSALNPRAAVDKQHKVLYLAEPDRSRVAIISGGGAGHEPAHSGFVDYESQDRRIHPAAVCGDVFASPNANQVKRALQLVENEKGILMVVKWVFGSYTGDILNFGLAREQYCAANPSKVNSLKFVVVGDDVSVGKKQGEIVGRRGLAGTVLVYKIAGALAQQGASLEEVHEVAQFVADRLGTIAVGLEHCHVPGADPGSTHLEADEIEVGMGIHNESGHTRVRPIPALPELVDKLLGYLFATPESDPDRSFLPWPERGVAGDCVLLVNNLGGLSALELSSAAKTISEKITESGINIERMLVGTYMTSLNMPGFSVTLLLLPQSDETKVSKDKLLRLLDAPAKTPAWTWTSGASPITRSSVASPQAEASTQKGSTPASNQFSDSVRRACHALIRAEPEITQMDQIVGDGDCGTTLKAGAEAVLDALNKPEFAFYGARGSISQIGQIVGDAMGGTSGALYSIYISALAQGLQGASSGDSGEPTRGQYADAAAFALERLYTYTRARPPSRTLVDPLAAFVESLKDPDAHLEQAFEAAQRAAEETKNLPARAGRAAYVNAEAVKGTCDPGAWGIRCLLEGLLKGSSK
ncbi:dihydroxyacetone kinase [Rhizoctonia solani]|uniref:Dihydroxyacetone kinase n=1 Tax=Rhizoctonia solani TaxID=456999 RepID=A0A8H7H755_9AGAM|nr:dihydroxyacetone kinase [Rhizoctonia solani]